MVVDKYNINKIETPLIQSDETIMRKMISSKELKLYDKLNKNSNLKKNIKYKKDGSLDMRYNMNKKIFREEYKNLILLENRKYNNISLLSEESYRTEILRLKEDELKNLFSKKLN